MTQDDALAILKTGANVFLTGEPGSGKSYTVNAYVDYLKRNGIPVAITASTGIAATHIGGVTIHAWSGIGIKATLSKYDLDRIASNEYVVKRMRKAKVLIIDEVSMLSAETLTMVDLVCREVLDPRHPFGGLQVVLVGDFFQLPPVMKSYQKPSQGLFGDTKAPRFAYDAGVWEDAQFLTCYLTEQHRQDDVVLLDLLSAVRRNEVEDVHFEAVASRRIAEDEAPDMTKLYTHNADVDRINSELLDAIDEDERTYAMTSRGAPKLVEGIKKGCLSPEQLSVKVGARVMFTKNNQRVGYVNGTIGTVTGFSEWDKYPIVETLDGKTVTAEPLEWTIEEGGKVRAAVAQIPLRLAWAITVHKSQGMTLDAAVLDLRSVFEYGQGYVALSRVRSLEGLYLLGWNARTFEVHPEVVMKDLVFRNASEEAARAFNALPQEELAQLHTNFVTAASTGKPEIPQTVAEDPEW